MNTVFELVPIYKSNLMTHHQLPKIGYISYINVKKITNEKGEIKMKKLLNEAFTRLGLIVVFLIVVMGCASIKINLETTNLEINGYECRIRTLTRELHDDVDDLNKLNDDMTTYLDQAYYSFKQVMDHTDDPTIKLIGEKRVEEARETNNRFELFIVLYTLLTTGDYKEDLSMTSQCIYRYETAKDEYYDIHAKYESTLLEYNKLVTEYDQYVEDNYTNLPSFLRGFIYKPKKAEKFSSIYSVLEFEMNTRKLLDSEKDINDSMPEK